MAVLLSGAIFVRSGGGRAEKGQKEKEARVKGGQRDPLLPPNPPHEELGLSPALKPGFSCPLGRHRVGGRHCPPLGSDLDTRPGSEWGWLEWQLGEAGQPKGGQLWAHVGAGWHLLGWPHVAMEG